MGSSLASNNCNQTLSSKSSYVGGLIILHALVIETEGFYLCVVTIVCKSGFKTGKRLQLDQTGPEKRPDCSLGLWYLKIKDRKKTGLFGPV